MFSRENRRQQGAKSKHIFEIKEGRRGVEVVGYLPFGVPTGAGDRGTLAILLTLAKMDKIPAFRPLSCFACLGLLANMALFRVLRAFLARFPLLDVGLYCLGALRGLWGFVRVWS